MNIEEEAKNVFNLLDDQKVGYITIDDFKNAFHSFSKETLNQEAEEDFKRIIDSMKPNKNGEIIFENFLPAFMEKMKMINNESKKTKNKIHAQYSIKRFLSIDTSDSESLEIKSPVDGVKPIYSEYNESRPGEIEYCYEPQDDNLKIENNFLENGLRRSMRSDKNKKSLQIRRKSNVLSLNDTNLGYPPNHTGPASQLLYPTAAATARSLLSAGASPHGSDHQSDICLKNAMSDNFDHVQQQLKRLEEKFHLFHNDQFDLESKDSQKIKEENQILYRRINTLEDNMKDLEDSLETKITEERNEVKCKMNKLEDEKQNELGMLENRRIKLETEEADIKLEVAQCKDEMNRLKIEKRGLQEELEKTERDLVNIQEELDNFRSSTKESIDKIKSEKIQFEKDVELLVHKSSSVSSSSAAATTRKCHLKSHHHSTSIDENDDVKLRKKELEENIAKLELERDSLTRQLTDLTCQLEGDGSSSISEESGSEMSAYHRELEYKTKEELMDILSSEKDANFKLKDYIEKIILKVMEKHPALLEIR